jgi:DNA-binding FadR family transcriptional regulator
MAVLTRSDEPGLAAVFRAVASRNAFEETVERLEQAIALGILQPGESLPSERRLVTLLNVSRSTLREAIRVLQHAGYVETTRGRGGGTTVVARADQITDKDARRLVRAMGSGLFDLLDQRRVLESGAAELAAERAGADDVQRLYRLLDDEAGAAAQRADFRRTHSQLHLGIAHAAGSEQLVNGIAEVHFRLADVIAAARLAQATINRSPHTHKRIVDAIGRHDAQAARQHMTGHVLATDRFLRSYARGESV